MRALLLIAAMFAALSAHSAVPHPAAAAAATPVATAAPAPAAADTAVKTQDSSFEIYAGEHRLGTEKFRVYSLADTVIMTSEVTLDGVAPESTLPRSKSAAFRQRAYDSYPVAFVAEEHPRRDTTHVNRVNVAFRDTVAMITLDRADRGRVESVGLPPGRLYLLEPGIYLQVQVLLADFLARGQETRKQSVLIPSLARLLDVQLTRGEEEDIVVRGARVHTRHVTMSDGLTTFEGWLDAGGRMWRLVADGQPLRVDRGPDARAQVAKTRPKHHAPRPKATGARTKP